MALNLSDAKRRTPWLTMGASAAERGRWRSVPVAEIRALEKQLAAAKARIAELEKTLGKSAARLAAAKARIAELEKALRLKKTVPEPQFWDGFRLRAWRTKI